mgnify:CR=1 FL=1
MLSFSKTIQHETCSVTKAAVSSYSIAGYIITYIQYSISETEICYCRFMTQGVQLYMNGRLRQQIDTHIIETSQWFCV